MDEALLAKRAALSAAAACAAAAATYPLDILKSRSQLARAPGVAAGARALVAGGGGSALYRGLPAALMRHAIYTPVRVGTFEALRDAVAARGGGGALPLGATLAIGLTAGAVGQLAAVPADLAKIQAQTAASGGRPAGGVAAALAATARRDGACALWRGATPAVQRAALVNLGEISTYSAVKDFVLQSRLAAEGPRANALAAVASGLVSAFVSTPADVLKTRLMAQDPRAPGAYRGMLDCATRCVREEGAAALWRGFWPTWMRLGPWQLVFWTSYEALRRAGGVAGS